MIDPARLHDELLAAHGAQHWWPAEAAFEIMVGALLVQRTSWPNAAAAVERLRGDGLLVPEALADAGHADIQRRIRGAGFYRSKARRLKKLAEFLSRETSIDGLSRLQTAELRQTLLALEGIGPETADAILLYAFERPAVVVDAYLRRLLQRLAGTEAPPADGALRAWAAAGIDDAGRLNELHALVVEHGKRTCGRRPLCELCRLRPWCRTGQSASEA